MSEPVAIVTALILDRPICTRYLLMEPGLTLSLLEPTLAAIERVLTVRRMTAAWCSVCRTTGTVFSI